MDPTWLTPFQFERAAGAAIATEWMDHWFNFCKRQNGNESDVLTPQKLSELRSAYSADPQAYKDEMLMVRVILAGHTPPYHVPGSKNRRIPTSTAIAFCETAHMEQAADILEEYLNNGTPITAPEYQLTTGDIAKITEISQSTATKWIDAYFAGDPNHKMNKAVQSGNPPPYVLPLGDEKAMGNKGSARRLPMSTFLAFSNITGMTHVIEKMRGREVICAAATPDTMQSVQHMIGDSTTYHFASSSKQCEAIVKEILSNGKLPIIVTHHSIGSESMNELAMKFGKNCSVIAIASPTDILRPGKFQAVFRDELGADIEAGKAVCNFLVGNGKAQDIAM